MKSLSQVIEALEDERERVSALNSLLNDIIHRLESQQSSSGGGSGGAASAIAGGGTGGSGVAYVREPGLLEQLACRVTDLSGLNVRNETAARKLTELLT